MEVACWHKGGGGRCSAAQKPRAKAHKMHFLLNKKLMTVMKFSSTNLLNCFVFCASFNNIKYLKLKNRINKVYAFFS